MVYIESKAFTARLHRLGRERRLWRFLIRFRLTRSRIPLGETWFRGLGGIRKARCPNPTRGKGKRGGFRYLFLHLEDRNQIYLLLDKDEQEDLSTDERKALRAWVSEIKGSRGAQIQ